MSVGLVISCDTGDRWSLCAARLLFEGTDLAAARRTASAEGWRHLNGRDLCPRHRNGGPL